jgi:hypothetical protein
MHRRTEGLAGRAIGFAVLIAVAACGASSATPSPASASPSPSAPGPTVQEDLTFTGTLSGHLASGSAGDTYVCAATGGAFVAGPILGTVAGQQIELNIVKLSFTGAGSYSPGGVSLDIGSDHYYPATGAAGALVIAPDLRSGTVDIDLAVNTDPNHAVAHVRGAWRCPPGGS